MKWIVLIVFGLLGLASLSGGLLWAKKRYELTQIGTMTQGVVVGQEEIKSSRPKGRFSSYERNLTGYYPIVEFETASGKKVRTVGTSGGGGDVLLENGTPVNVIYNPDDPTDALIVDFTQAWLGPLALSVVGTVMLLMGVGGFVLMGKLDRGMDEMASTMQADRLALRSDRITIKARIIRVEQADAQHPDRYVFIASGKRPDGDHEEEFRSEYIPFKPVHSYFDHTVTVYLDPDNRRNYLVDLAPVLKDLSR